MTYFDDRFTTLLIVIFLGLNFVCAEFNPFLV